MPISCGSGLARDSITAVFQIHRGVCIASKPAPTLDWVRLQNCRQAQPTSNLWNRTRRIPHFPLPALPSVAFPFDELAADACIHNIMVYHHTTNTFPLSYGVAHEFRN